MSVSFYVLVQSCLHILSWYTLQFSIFHIKTAPLSTRLLVHSLNAEAIKKLRKRRIHRRLLYSLMRNFSAALYVFSFRDILRHCTDHHTDWQIRDAWRYTCRPATAPYATIIFTGKRLWWTLCEKASFPVLPFLSPTRPVPPLPRKKASFLVPFFFISLGRRRHTRALLRFSSHAVFRVCFHLSPCSFARLRQRKMPTLGAGTGSA